jgi:FKBP-type peptidyl-prolyl cis-trans isomerase
MRFFIILLLISVSINSFSQPIQTIPAFTGYAVPAEQDEAILFQQSKGVVNWTNLQQSIEYHAYIRKTGKLELALNVRNTEGASKLQVVFGPKSFDVTVPMTKSLVRLPIGSINIKDSGFITIQLKGLKKTGNQIAEIASLELKGTASEGIHFNTKERRNAASVHLRYPIPDTTKAIAFYSEISIPEKADIVHSYYMSNGFARGYFGIQVNSEMERRVIFSIWDAGSEAKDRGKVADSNRVQLLAKGEGVVANDFGNEGTGGHSHWVYPWKAGVKYQLLVTALPDSATNSTIYTGYFFLPELKKWKLIAAFKAPKDGKYLRNLYSFNENFVGLNGQLKRQAYFGNQWIQRENGSWLELTEAKFSYDATGKAGDRIDYGASVENGQFYLWNAGFEKATTAFGDILNRPTLQQKPVLDWTKNADSIIQAQKDNALIFDAVKQKKIDTAGSVNGVYYAILNAGNGDRVSVTDTVTVYYKGSLLKDSSIFDQTKDKPATFPLTRLIKGWQIGLPICKVGGKIRLFIPSGLAYSIRTRSNKIPPNSVLVFDIEVLSVKNKKD